MMNITTGKVPKAQKVVLYGVEGIGKSTFASQFPDALFIDTEDSTQHMEVSRFDKPTSWTMLMQQVEFVKNNRPCRTLVIDTIDWAEEICKKHLMAANGWSAIDAEGYGKKFAALATEMGKLLDKLSDVIDVGINVVVVAHAMLRKKEEPDEMGAYDRYELKLEKKTAPLVKEWSDNVLFAKYMTTILTDSKTNSKKATGGQRMMYTTHRPAWDAKNRWNLPDELPFEFAQIAQAFAEATAGVGQPVQQPPNQPVPTQSEPAPIMPLENDVPLPEPQPDFSPDPIVEINPAIPKPVADLMVHDRVSFEEIMQVIYVGGFMPADTPVENIPPDLWGYFQANWDKAVNLLNTKIRTF